MTGLPSRIFEVLAQLHRKVPLAAATGLLLCGTACGYRVGEWLPVAAAAALCVLWLVWLRVFRQGVRARTAAFVMACALVLVGWARAAWDAGGRQRDAARLTEGAPRVTFVCRVGSEVAVRPLRGEAAKYSFRAEGVRLEGAGGSRALRHLPVDVSWFGACRADGTNVPQPGAVWRLSGRAVVRKGRAGLLASTVNSGEGRSCWIADADPGAWASRIADARRRAAERVTIGIENWGAIPALNQAMMLGCRNEMPPALRRIFADSGTIHVFAISGLHIALVTVLLVLAVNMLGVGRTHLFFIVAPLLVFYTFTTGARPSAIRACLMALLVLAAPLAGRRPDGLTALLGTALVVHALQPSLLFDIGNVLSFVVMGGLVAFCGPFCEIGRRLFGCERLKLQARLYSQAGRAAAAARLGWAEAALRWLADSLAVSLAAWLASVPLTAYYFGRFTPGGLLANLVVVPCSFLIVVAGSLGLVSSAVSGWVASCFNHAAGFFTCVMVWTAEWTASCAWGSFRVRRWELWQLGGWFVMLAALAVWLKLRQSGEKDGLAWLEDEGQGKGGHA